MQEVTTDVLEGIWELELEVEPEDVIDHWTSMDEESYYGWAKKVASWNGIYSCEDAVKTGEMINQDLEYYLNLIDKAMEEFERNDSNFERSSTDCKMLSKSITYSWKIIHERRVIDVANFTVVLFYEIATATQPSAITTLSSQQPNNKSRPFISKKITTCW